MNGFGKLFVVCLGSAALAGCGTQLEQAEKLTPQGSAFDLSLYDGYLGLAKSETGEGDYRDSDTFATRAIYAGTGRMVGPEEVASRNLPADKVGELGSARERLVTALGRGAAQKLPGDAAEAQVKFDCWMQEQEENFQPDDIAACRGGFYDALAKLESGTKKVAKAAPKPAPEAIKFIVYFDFNSTDLDAKGKEVVFQAEAAARRLQGGRVVVSGFTDTVGSAAYNQTLSELRAGAVAKVLSADGYPTKQIKTEGFGKTNLAVPTGDGVADAGNRRAVIYVQPK